MKYRFLLSFFITLITFFSNASRAQIVGPDAFLQGAYLEIGLDEKGAFGTCSSPAGYHPHVSGTALGEVYDYGHDGWTVAATTGWPPYMGDYTEPGYPFEGWSVEVAGTEYRNWVDAGFCGGSFFIPGGITGYSNTGGRITGTFTGNVAGLHIIAESRIDTYASAVVTTVRFYNTSAAPVTDIYYERTCDPDNVSTWGGSYSTTHNNIVHQNEDDRHLALVSSVCDYPMTGDYNLITYMGLGTKDCRARVCFFSGGLTPGTNPGAIYHNATGYYETLGDSTFNDVGYALVYNLGTLNPAGTPGDSTVISFAYFFNTNSGFDSAFPEPVMVVNGVVSEPSGPAPAPTIDTFLPCAPGASPIVTVNILNASDKCWTWSKWTWSPSIGLSATTGVSNIINSGSLSGPTTYTITGTDSAMGMYSCHNRVMYLTIIPCFTATSSSPGPEGTPWVDNGDGTYTGAICLYDTLLLAAHGDSTDATYFWYGPGGYTSTGQFTKRNPPLAATDTGWYYVVKTVGTAHDTTKTRVIFNPTPVVTVTSNGPVCSGTTLNLFADPDSATEKFDWIGPNGFTSTLQNPSVTGIPVSGGGIYKVHTNLYGCKDSGSITVIVDTTPATPTIGSNSPVCSGPGDTLKLTASDVTPGVGYAWSGPASFTASIQNPAIVAPNVSASGIYTVTASITADGITCSSSNTTVVAVDSTPYLPVLTSNGPICSGNSLVLTATSTDLSDYLWLGPNSFTTTTQNPTINPASTLATGTYTVTASITYATGGALTCTSDVATLAVEVDSTPEVPYVTSNSPVPAIGPSICQGDTLKLFASDSTPGVSYGWVGPNSFLSIQQNPIILHVNPAATGTYTVTVALGSCINSATTTVTITPTPPLIATNNGPICTGIQDTLLLQALSGPGATYVWSGPYVFSSLNQNPYRTPVIKEYEGVYQVQAMLNGCPSEKVNDTVYIRQRPKPPGVPWLTYCQYFAAPPLQAMGDSILWYPTIIPVSNGSLTAPVPSTDNVGVTWFYVSQTLNSCTSAIDSARINVIPKPTVTVTGNLTLCPRDSAILTAVDTDPFAYYHWSPPDYLSDTSLSTVIVRPEKDVHYTVVASNQFGCTDTALVTVAVHSGAVINLGDSVTLYPGESYQINTQSNCTSFEWFPPAGLDDAHLSNPLAAPQISTKYIVHAETEWGCKIVDSINIYIDPSSSIAIPNAFTPGNGPNGTFRIIKRGIAELNYFRIWDRWGVKVFETTNIDEGWDGMYKGKPQPFGVFVYEVSALAKDGKEFVKHGNVTLIR